MKILHLAASNRWTGAAAPALAEVEALRAAGVEAHFAYVGGYKFEQRLGTNDWTHPVIRKREDPVSIVRSVGALRTLIDSLGIDIVHSHLTYDHWLAILAARGRKVRVVRTYHSKRTLRRGLAMRWLLGGTSSVYVVNSSFIDNRATASKAPMFTPPPVDHDFFSETRREETRRRYGFDEHSIVIGVIGKVARERGFEEAIETFRLIRAKAPAARLFVIGHGPHRPALEAKIAALALSDAVVWAGYQEMDLPAHFSAMDAMLFTRTGSDEGHRAVVEAMACGTPVFSYPIDGIASLYGGHSERFVADASEPSALATLVLLRLKQTREERTLAREITSDFSFERTATRLIGLYERLV